VLSGASTHQFASVAPLLLTVLLNQKFKQRLEDTWGCSTNEETELDWERNNSQSTLNEMQYAQVFEV
jgi:hypothetical protein